MSCTYCLYLKSYNTTDHLSTLNESCVLYWVNLNKIIKKDDYINLSNSINIHIPIWVCPVCPHPKIVSLLLWKNNKNSIKYSSKRQYAMQNSNNHHKAKKDTFQLFIEDVLFISLKIKIWHLQNYANSIFVLMNTSR